MKSMTEFFASSSQQVSDSCLTCGQRGGDDEANPPPPPMAHVTSNGRKRAGARFRRGETAKRCRTEAGEQKQAYDALSVKARLPRPPPPPQSRESLEDSEGANTVPARNPPEELLASSGQQDSERHLSCGQGGGADDENASPVPMAPNAADPLRLLRSWLMSWLQLQRQWRWPIPCRREMQVLSNDWLC